MNRIREIDIIKGLGIILVVLGHSFPDAEMMSFNGNNIYKLIYNIIYSFHMPLFIFASGYVSYKLLNIKGFTNKYYQIKKKFLRLIVPYIIISIPALILKYFFADLAYNSFNFSNSVVNILLGRSPMGGVWFLYALFLIFVIVLFTNNIKLEIMLLIFTLINIFSNNITEIFNLNKISQLGVFFFLGIAANKYNNFTKLLIKNRLTTILSLFSFIPMVYCSRYLGISIGKLFCSVMGIYLTLVTSTKIIKYNLVANVIEEFGRYSFDIYIISWFVQIPIRVILFTILKIDYTNIMILMFILGLAIPYYVSKVVLRKYKITNTFILGNFYEVSVRQTRALKDSIGDEFNSYSSK